MTEECGCAACEKMSGIPDALWWAAYGPILYGTATSDDSGALDDQNGPETELSSDFLAAEGE